MSSSHLLESDFALPTGKHTQITKENSRGMRDLSASNVSHVSRKPLQCMHITTPYTGHVVEVTFRNHYNAYNMVSNRTRLSSSLFNRGKSNVIFQYVSSVHGVSFSNRCHRQYNPKYIHNIWSWIRSMCLKITYQAHKGSLFKRQKRHENKNFSVDSKYRTDTK